MKVFGKRRDGTLEICKAKEENRGKGRCFHYEHIEVTRDQLHDSFVQRFNERVLEEKYGPTHTIQVNSNSVPINSSEKVRPSLRSEPMSKEELLKASEALAEQISDEDWSMLKDFQDEWHRRVSDGELTRRLGGVEKNLEDYLKSDSKVAIETRRFLGDIDLSDFSEVITGEVSSMTNVSRWYHRLNSVSRPILTALNNDMNKERYIASIMFFGGRCCYCNNPLRRRPPRDRQASGEHLTALSPSPGGEEKYGSTRYGNMALACVRCNQDRGNKEMVEFIRTSKHISDSERANVLGRIKAFRKFALYEEFPPKKNRAIGRAISELNSEIHEERREGGGRLSREKAEYFKKKIKETIYDLQFDGE